MAHRIFKNQKSLKFFMGSFFPLLLIAIFSCCTFSAITMKIVTNSVKDQAFRTVLRVSERVRAYFRPAITGVNTFCAYADVNYNKDDLKILSKAITKDMDFVSSMYYATVQSRFSKDGFFIDSSDWEPEKNWEPSNFEWFKKTISADGELIIQQPEIDELGEISLTVSRAIKDADQKILGMVGLDMGMDNLTNKLDEMKLTQNCRVYVIDSEGNYLSNKNKSLILKGNYFEDTDFDETQESFLTAKSNILIKKGHFYASLKIRGTEWYAIADGPISDFSRSFTKTLGLVFLGLIVLSIACAVFNLIFIHHVQKKEQKLGAELYEETQNLVVSAKENAATSQDQAAAVKEIVATMEDSNKLSENISIKIKDVSSIASKTSSDVAEGVKSIEQNVEQLHAIFEANQTTIRGMKELAEKIESIWDIVTLINSVADQAKIIAFNAELEASSAGEAGKNFHIVANEIRRLADGIIDGTKEIKEKINEIQHSSDSLILMSESGTEKINSGYDSAKNLELKFESIKSASEITADSAGDITDIIQQQSIASEQILIALKQISSGVENFTLATDSISSSSENLRVIAQDLNNQVKEV